MAVWGCRRSINPDASPFLQFDQATCTHEKLILLIESIIEKMRVALDEMKPGERRDRELYDAHVLLMMAHDKMKEFDKALERIQIGLGVIGSEEHTSELQSLMRT